MQSVEFAVIRNIRNICFVKYGRKSFGESYEKERSTFNACKIAPNQNRTVSFSLISRLAKSKVQLMLQCNHQVRRWIILCMTSVTNAEIIWTLKNVQANFLLKSCESLPKVFQELFPDSVIAKNFTFSKDKCSYYINYGVGPCYKSVLANEIKASPYYSTSLNNLQR